VNFLHIYDMKYGNNLFVQIDTSAKKFKRLTVKDKILPTAIKLNRVDKFLSSMVDSCLLCTVTIFNIVSLHFRKRGGTNLLLSVASLGR
jgi:PP-loop superfamily ATP-utilizing enzyme